MGDYAKLWKEAVKMTRDNPKSKKKAPEHEPTQEEKIALRAVPLQGEYTRAVQSLKSTGLA